MKLSFKNVQKAGLLPGFLLGRRTARDIAIMLRTALAVLVLMLSACATLGPDYEPPVVTLASLKALPSEGMVPEFEAVLRVTNPNAQPLKVEGIVYTLSVQDRDLIKSVGKGFEPIEGYSEGTVTVRGSVSLLQGVRLVSDLINNNDGLLEYEFKAKLDLDGFNPTVRISETGTLDLSGKTQP